MNIEEIGITLDDIEDFTPNGGMVEGVPVNYWNGICFGRYRTSNGSVFLFGDGKKLMVHNQIIDNYPEFHEELHQYDDYGDDEVSGYASNEVLSYIKDHALYSGRVFPDKNIISFYISPSMQNYKQCIEDIKKNIGVDITNYFNCYLDKKSIFIDEYKKHCDDNGFQPESHASIPHLMIGQDKLNYQNQQKKNGTFVYKVLPTHYRDNGEEMCDAEYKWNQTKEHYTENIKKRKTLKEIRKEVNKLIKESKKR